MILSSRAIAGRQNSAYSPTEARLSRRNFRSPEVSNKMMADLKSKTAIYAKAIMFVVIGVTSSALLIAQNFTLQTAILVALVIWSFCRAYYFAFYVIEHYVDPGFRFAGLFAFAKYLIKRQS